MAPSVRQKYAALIQKVPQLGVLDTSDAIRQAEEFGLDLVEVQPNVDPPVCKILDYGKYKYEAQKRANEARKKQKIIEVKEIKLRPKYRRA
jgi:translation initiation factor IF-3